MYVRVLALFRVENVAEIRTVLSKINCVCYINKTSTVMIIIAISKRGLLSIPWRCYRVLSVKRNSPGKNNIVIIDNTVRRRGGTRLSNKQNPFRVRNRVFSPKQTDPAGSR